MFYKVVHLYLSWFQQFVLLYLLYGALGHFCLRAETYFFMYVHYFLSFPFIVIYHILINALPYVSNLSTVNIIEFSNISCRRMIVVGKRVEHIML